VGSTLPGPPVREVEGVVRTQVHPRAKRCYQDALNQGFRGEGTVTVQATILEDGAVESVDIVASFGLPYAISACVARAAADATFPPAGPGGGTVSIPIRFVSANVDKASSDARLETGKALISSARACASQGVGAAAATFEVTVGTSQAENPVRVVSTTLPAQATECIRDTLERTDLSKLGPGVLVLPFEYGRFALERSPR
jgi:TonB family protein